MLWRAVASYLAFVLAVGPGLCCCTTTSVAAMTGSAQGRPTGHSQPRPSCCCPDQCSANAGLAHGQERVGGDDGDHQKSHTPGKHRCPCRDKATKKIDQSPTASAVQDVARILTLAFQFAVVESVPVVPVNPALDSGGERSPPGHRLTAERLLDLHHLLRC